MNELSHVNREGEASMVDVTGKPVVSRVATASGFIEMQAETIDLVNENKIKKGDVLTVAKIAGISAAKQTSALIPLCHSLSLSHVSVDCVQKQNGILVSSTVKTAGKTGVEMEALCAVSVAALTLYDMCKAVDKTMVIGDITLESKRKD
ncbi:MAG: cyclic pyranopterin monophosphate synthase MoaC [Verrucomicrobiota bacterium]|jgi:cyclic pyranopterin phosphate synthase|nr:cyclic pyranopterin monophosphate synthase MoaC [Verrucomicrobiota bacterium]MED6299053.1 cyclic pyranopterin monophosphate synthase MoaC [Verrucomicrobiota bacterium]MEE3177623.1 cyclic pyranopterin monophosphate synthase MoaC [Verrucomicrobiota bacterium]